MCNKCGYASYNNSNKIQENAMKMAFAQNVANEILGFMNCIWDIATPNTTDRVTVATEETTEAEKVTSDKESSIEDSAKLKEDVEKILKNNKIEVSENVLNEVVKKYSTMKQFNSGKYTLEQRVVNYAKGLSNYGKTEKAFGQGDINASYDITGVQEAKAEGSMDKYLAAYNNAADEYIELCDDKKGDGRISLTEFIAKETGDANIDIDKLNNKKTRSKFAAEYITFQALDLDQSGYLEKEEVAGMLNWTSVQDENGENITFADNQSFGEDLANFATSTLKLNKKDTKKFIEYFRQNNRSAALELIKDKTNISDKDYSNVVNTFRGYTEAVQAFTKAKLK